MKTHRSPVVALASNPGRTVRLAVAFAVAIAALTTSALAADSPDATKTPASSKVYTNADLKKYATEDSANKDSKEPSPSQYSPVVTESKEGWDFVLAMIDREHEKAARSQEAANAAAAAYEASKYEPEPTYYAPYYGYGFSSGCFNGDCGHGCNGPYTHRSNCTPQGTNTFRPLDERGVRTPHDLWRETRRNGAIQRSQIMAPPQGFAVVPARSPK